MVARRDGRRRRELQHQRQQLGVLSGHALPDTLSPAGKHFHGRSGHDALRQVFFIDDSPPVVGDWPEDKDDAADYIFGRDQLGGHDLEVEVDGNVTSLDESGYIGGPVPTPDSPDRSDHMIQIGAFLTPLAKGAHSVTIRGVFDGDAALEAFGGPFAAEVVWTVIVK
jgi:hypothetical protein